MENARDNENIHESWLFPSFASITSLALVYALAYFLASQKNIQKKTFLPQLYRIAASGKENAYGLLILIFVTNFLTFRITKKMI